MLPQKKDNSLEDILNTIRCGDEYDYENIIRHVDNELINPAVTNESLSLCCDVIEALLDHYIGNPRWSPLELCTKVIDGHVDMGLGYRFGDDPPIDIIVRAVDIFHRSLKKEIKRGSDQDVLARMPLMWFTHDALLMCIADKSNALLKTCLELCETLVKTCASEGIVDDLVSAIELEATNSPSFAFGRVPYEVVYLVPFTKSKDKKTAERVKKCLKEFFEDFTPSEDQEDQKLLPESIRKQLLKFKP